MSGRMLVELADWLRAAGLVVVEYDGWQHRARSSGGYADGRPWCVMWHHTASMADPADDAAYCAVGDPDAPICNLLVDRAGVVWVIAAGATNTNGKGYALTFSRGTVPDDSMNTYAVGIEICNNGTGEPYPQAQIDSAFASSIAITAALGLEATDVAQHHDWAPDRKIDPARADAVTGVWEPSPVNTSGSWSLADLRGELAARAGNPPSPPPPPLKEDDDVIVIALDHQGTAWIGDGITRLAIADPAVFDRYCLVWKGRLLNVSGGTVAGWDDVGAAVDDKTLQTLGRPS